METKQMKEAKKNKGLDGSKEVLKVLRQIESHLAEMAYYQNPSRGLGQSVQKHASAAFTEGTKAQVDLRAMIMEELQKLIKETK